MTTIYVCHSKDQYIVAGRNHADDPTVCSAISATMCGLYNTIHTLNGIIPGECDGFEERSGSVTVRFRGVGMEAYAVYAMAVETFKLIAEAAPQNVKILPYGGENIPEI